MKKYEAQIVKSPVEHAIIITRKGEVYHCNGDEHGIPLNYFEQMSSELVGAHVTHNHPPRAKENDNTFSNEDFSLFSGFKLTRLRGVDLKFTYELNRNPKDLDFEELTFEELMALMAGEIKDAHRYVGLKAKMGGIGYRRWSR